MKGILGDDGVAEALEYIDSKRGGILTRVQNRRAAEQGRNRTELQHLLSAAQLYATEGQAQKARET